MRPRTTSRADEALPAHEAPLRPYSVHISIAGRRYEIWIADRTAELWYAHDRSGRDHPYAPEIQFLCEHGRLGPGGRVFDLGAHQSVIALFLGQIVGETGHVVSVEASEHNVEVARKNRKLNAMTNLEIVYGAVGATTGRVDFLAIENGRIGTANSPGTRRVDAWTLDDLARRHGMPDVVFMDIEGFEQQALAAAPQVLAARPDFFVEVHAGVGLEDFGGSVEGVRAFFPESAYRCFLAVPGKHGECEFRPAEQNPLPAERFYLIALGRSADRSPGVRGGREAGGSRGLLAWIRVVSSRVQGLQRVR